MHGIRLLIPVLILTLLSGEEISLVRGTVESDSGMVGDSLVAELELSDHTQPRLRCSIASDGAFEFRGATAGWHVLRITTLLGAVVAEQSVHVNANSILSIRLPKEAASQAGPGTAVSARR